MTDTMKSEALLSVDHYEFKPNPIKGYPELWWRGKKPFTSTRFYPAQLKETHGKSVEGPDGKEWRNKIFWGDNLQVMSHLLKEFRGKVDLIYIDPPFDSRADYKKSIDLKGSKTQGDYGGFEEKQYTDIWSNDEYLQFMYERIVLLRELLSENGSIYLHCDQTKGHLLRVLLDEVMGAKNFMNEVIWCYSERGISKTYWNKKHDTILFYAKKKGEHFFDFSNVRDEYSEDYLKKFKYEDDNGKYQIRGKNIKGSPVQRADGLNPEHEIKYPGLTYRQYFEGGMLPKDWWEIPLLNKAAHERTGYPTQKPEELIERIILASSPENGIVFDCFMGSGTTQAVSMRLGRRFIGADINLGAVQTTTKRLLSLADNLAQQQPKLGEDLPLYFTGFEVYNVNNYDVFRNPVQAKELLIDALEINKFPADSLFDGEKDGRLVKIMPVNRIATRADLNDLISGFDYAEFGKRKLEHPARPVEKITLVCMGHEPDLKAQLQKQVGDYRLDIEVVDILRDRQDLQFKRDSEAEIVVENGELIVKQFFPLNLLQKLSLQQENVTDWREMVESVMIDWNYDGAVITEPEVDIPDKKSLVKGRYKVPQGASNIRVKITDLLSESLEMDVPHD